MKKVLKGMEPCNTTQYIGNWQRLTKLGTKATKEGTVKPCSSEQIFKQFD